MPDAIYKQIVDKVVTTIQGLSLTGVSSSSVAARKNITSRPDQMVLPAVLVAPYGSKAGSPGAGVVGHDDIPYGVLVVAIAAGNQDQTTNYNRQVQWEQSIRRAFINRRLSSIDGADVYTAQLANDVTFDLPAWLQQYDASIMVWRFIAREPRA